MRAARTLARVLQQLLLCSLYPSSGLGATSPPVSMASASMATASWKTVWVDEFQSEVQFPIRTAAATALL